MKKAVTNSGDSDETVVYLYDGEKMIETRDGSNNMVCQFIHDVQHIDELVMMRAKDRGDLYVHQGERGEWDRAATAKAGRDACAKPATCPQGVSTMPPTGGTNFMVALRVR